MKSSSRHQISMIEAIGYTVLIAFIAATAEGWFNLMIPWSTSS